MGIPRPVPSLSKEESAQFQESLSEFEVSEEVKKGVEEMEELIENDNS